MYSPLLIFLLTIAATLALAVILLLLVPFVFRFELKGGSGAESVQNIEVQWLFLSRAVNGAAAAEQEDRRGQKEEKKEKEGKEEKGKKDAKKAEKKKEKTVDEMTIDRLFELIRTLHRPVVALVRNVVRRITIKELSCRAAFGLDDPAETGMLAGFLYAASAPLTCLPAVSIRMDPVFWDRTLAYRAVGSIRITVGRMVVPVVVFLCDRSVRAVIARYIRSEFL